MSDYTGKAKDLWHQFLLLWDSTTGTPKYKKDDWKALSDEIYKALKLVDLEHAEKVVQQAQALCTSQGGNPRELENPDRHIMWRKTGERKMEFNFRNHQLIKDYILPNGCAKKAFVTASHDYVIGMALTQDNQIILCREYRPGPERILLDMPTGSINKGEKPLAAMVTELEEETGYAGDIEFIGTSPVGPYTIQKRHTFLIQNCKKVGPQKLDKDEFIEGVLMPLEDYVRLVRKGETTNAASVLYCLDRMGSLNISF